MLLSDEHIEKRRVSADMVEKFITHWKNGQWAEIGDRILISPYKSHLLGSCTYDLEVGNQYASLRQSDAIRILQPTDSVRIEPGETVLILTEEYLALPRNVAGLVVPRARRIFRGMMINATRIDPTWYGKLVVGVTNLSKQAMELSPGESFCSCLFLETYPVRTAISMSTTPSLGRTNLQRSELPGTIPRLKAASEVTRDDLNATAELFGKPWDIMRGAFEITKNEIIEYIDKEKGPAIVQDATDAAIKRAFGSQNKLLYISFGGIVIPIALAATLYLLRLVHLLPT
jgi:deoxycytidine triphosphate deaminase